MSEMCDVPENHWPAVSIIIPTLNEEESIGPTLKAMAPFNGEVEVIVADGGSVDRTVEIARQFGARVVSSDGGRGLQMHSGAGVARGRTLLFLHADTLAPPATVDQVNEALSNDVTTVGGNFDLRFSGESWPARFMTWLYPRLRKVGLCYGDSGIFVRAAVYREMEGFKPIPIFEDLDFIQRLKRRGRMIHLPLELITSSRRFEGRSFVAMFARWSVLQGLYWLGVKPSTLSRLYAPQRKQPS